MRHKRMLVSLSGMALLILCLLPCVVRRNITDSLPYHLFLKVPAGEYVKGSYVSFEHPLSKTPLVKIIQGLPGDTIQFNQGHIWVGGVDCGIPKERSPSGLLLKPIEASVIPEGWAFLFSPHPDSFDSRYAEFGLIHTESVQEVLWPLF